MVASGKRAARGHWIRMKRDLRPARAQGTYSVCLKFRAPSPGAFLAS